MKYFVNKADLMMEVERIISQGKNCFYRECKGVAGWLLFFQCKGGFGMRQIINFFNGKTETFLHEDDAHLYMDNEGFKYISYSNGQFRYEKGDIVALMYEVEVLV